MASETLIENEKALPGRAELLDKIEVYRRIKEVRDCDNLDEIKTLLRSNNWIAFGVTNEGKIRLGRLWTEPTSFSDFLLLVSGAEGYHLLLRGNYTTAGQKSPNPNGGTNHDKQG